MPLYSLFKSIWLKLSCLYNKLFNNPVTPVKEENLKDKGRIDVISCKVQSIKKKHQ